MLMEGAFSRWRGTLLTPSLSVTGRAPDAFSLGDGARLCCLPGPSAASHVLGWEWQLLHCDEAVVRFPDSFPLESDPAWKNVQGGAGQDSADEGRAPALPAEGGGGPGELLGAPGHSLPAEARHCAHLSHVLSLLTRFTETPRSVSISCHTDWGRLSFSLETREYSPLNISVSHCVHLLMSAYLKLSLLCHEKMVFFC